MTQLSSKAMAARWVALTAPWSLALRCGLLVAITLAAAAVVAVWKYQAAGPRGILAAGAAAGICLAGALVALVLTAKMRSTPHAAVSSMLLGMFFRMGLPLAAVLLLQRPQAPLVDAGITGCLLAIYPVTLLTEVALAVSLLQNS